MFCMNAQFVAEMLLEQYTAPPRECTSPHGLPTVWKTEFRSNLQSDSTSGALEKIAPPKRRPSLAVMVFSVNSQLVKVATKLAALPEK